jgi:hypothetical protein
MRADRWSVDPAYAAASAGKPDPRKCFKTGGKIRSRARPNAGSTCVERHEFVEIPWRAHWPLASGLGNVFLIRWKKNLVPRAVCLGTLERDHSACILNRTELIPITPVSTITITVTILKSTRCYWKFCIEPNSTMFLAAEKAHSVIQTYVVINPPCTLKP